MPTGGRSWTYFDVKVHSTCLEIFMVHCRKCHIFVRLSAQNVVLIFSAEEKHNLQKERKITAREERRMFPFWETINWVTAEKKLRTFEKISFYFFQMIFLIPLLVFVLQNYSQKTTIRDAAIQKKPGKMWQFFALRPPPRPIRKHP